MGAISANAGGATERSLQLSNRRGRPAAAAGDRLSYLVRAGSLSTPASLFRA